MEKRLLTLTDEKEVLEKQIKELKSALKQRFDAAALVDEVMTSIKNFKDLFAHGTLDEQKQFIRLFVDRINVDPKKKRVQLHIRKFPMPQSLGTGNHLLELVAGAGYKHQKIRFPTIEMVEMSLGNRRVTLVLSLLSAAVRSWLIRRSAEVATSISPAKIARQRVQRDVRPEECRLFNCPTSEHYDNGPSITER